MMLKVKEILMLRRGLLITAVLFAPLGAQGQDRPVQWQRTSDATEIPITVFHSPQSANLPTAETMLKGEWQFEISHRFIPPFKNGPDALWGLDGPINNRLGIAYAVHDRGMVTLQRTNLNDNLDLNAKVRLFEAGRKSTPVMVAVVGGVAWNGDAPSLLDGSTRPWQYYGQLTANVMLGERFALGVVPSFLRNPLLNTAQAQNTYSVGIMGQLYLSPHVSVLGEWNISEERVGQEYDAGTFGIELETGGHFFKIMASNSVRLNPAQFMAGTPFSFDPGEWRLSFNITRLLQL